VDLNQLKARLELLAESLNGEQKRILAARLTGLASVFPFSEYEYMLMFLLDKKVIKFEQYEKLRADYVATNRYLDLFGLAPRIFGEIWAHGHVQDLDSRFQKPDKSLDPTYSGEYDLRLENVKVELKAARAINTRMRGSLSSKALSKGSAEPFWMNFQQIKPDAAGVFIFIGVWVDSIVYWVLSRAEIKKNPYLSHQHRGGIEYQIGITDKNISQFDKFRVEPARLAQAVIARGASRGK
jgi:hypothetical protein